ncbi:GCG_CRPN prefix-to-repeats domain-containing protein [Rhizobium binxianense]
MGQAGFTAPKAISVDWACGRGWHQTPWGDCRPNWRRPPPPPPRYVYRRGWDGPREWHHRPPPPRWERRWDGPRW